MPALRLHPDADAEAIAAASWIKANDPKEGTLFIEALKDALERATCQPEVYRCFQGDLRKVRVGKFSYAVIFRVKADETQVLAVMHLHRRPGYWRKRAHNWPNPSP